MPRNTIGSFTVPVLIEDLGMRLPTPQSNNPRHYGLYQCPFCDTKYVAQIHDVKHGTSITCGQHSKSIKHGLSNHPLHGVWRGIKDRCSNENKSDYVYYGERGISICDEWKGEFINFYNWAIANGYQKGLELDRLDNDGNYSPQNCRWATHSENVFNARLLKSNNKSGVRGVRLHNGRWVASSILNGVKVHLGSFVEKRDAAIAYNDFITEHNIKAPLNSIENPNMKYIGNNIYYPFLYKDGTMIPFLKDNHATGLINGK